MLTSLQRNSSKMGIPTYIAIVWNRLIGIVRVQPKPHSAGVQCRPPILFLLLLVLGSILHRLQPWPLYTGIWPSHIGVPLMVMAMVLILWSIQTFKRHRTPIPPWEPVKALVMAGPYRYTRNPMYVAMALFSLGFAGLLNTMWIPLLLVPLLGFIQWAVIRKEEQYLTLLFGEAYRQYQRTVRRWL